jgi:arylsulfatase
MLVIMADDIGYWNISAYNRGMMGYRTPNIDRLANEGAIFTDYYGPRALRGKRGRNGCELAVSPTSKRI